MLLGIECGGTHTVSLLATTDGKLLQRHESGAANLRLLTDEALLTHFRSIRLALGIPNAIGVGIAGARGTEDCQRVQKLLAEVWPQIPSCVGHDLESALAAAGLGQSPNQFPLARVIILAGTGSCTYGKTCRGLVAKVGGWGHLLGDHGSGYDIGFTALRAIIATYDQTGAWPKLSQHILRALQLSDPEELIAWVQQATKTEIAALATHVFATQNTPLSATILQQTSKAIATDAAMCARQLGCSQKPIEFVFAGGVFTRQNSQVRRVRRHLRTLRPGMRDGFQVLERESAWGAVALAESALRGLNPTQGRRPAEKSSRPLLKTRRNSNASLSVFIPSPTAPSPTEQRNPRSTQLDQLSTAAAVELMISEDLALPQALRSQAHEITRLIDQVAKSLRKGGRLIYVGAGTSGRLGVLDASECPPTFRSNPSQVQGIMAGGVSALHSSVEGAEDDPEAGARAIAFRDVTRRDVVVGLAASGRTPYVWGALTEARQRGAFTAMICCNPNLEYPARSKPKLVIALDVGPEVLTGSTRLKAGTVTKLTLNMITTLAMVRLGKVVSNLMVDLNPSNSKLRDRAIRIVQTLTGADPAAVKQTLESHQWHVKESIDALKP